MNALEFFSSIIQSLAWPISIILIIIILRKPISELVKGINKVKYQDLEIDFGKKLDNIDVKISKNNKIKITKKYSKSEEVEEIETIALISPKSAIIMAWTLVEKEIQEAINRLAISPDYPPYNSSLKNIELLKDNNLIDNETINAIEEMRKLRNIAAHAVDYEKKITSTEAIKYYGIAQEVVIILQSLNRN